MKYYKINYDKLANLKQTNYYLMLKIIIGLIIIGIIIMSFVEIDNEISFYGIYDNNRLHIKIDNTLSDVVKTNNKLSFNNQVGTYKIDKYLDYEFIGKDLYQNIDLIVDTNFIDNEIGIVSIHCDKRKLLAFIFDLFK